MRLEGIKEFKVNDHISLKFDGDKTALFLKDEEFKHCFSLILNLKRASNLIFNESQDIDKLLVDYSRYLTFERKRHSVLALEEFWAYCSSIQAWVEYDYDSNLLPADLAFSLLKKLTELGDLKAKEVFEIEIKKRLESGYYPVMKFLIKEGYSQYLKDNDIKNVLHKWDVEYIEELLKRFKLLDPQNLVFGAKNHKYKINPPCTEEEVLKFEQEFQIKLPLEYRNFLITIGNGGAGPCYGIFKLGRTIDSVGRSIALKEGFSYGNLTKEFFPSHKRKRKVNGAIPISFCGGTTMIFIEVPGKNKGILWERDEDGFICLKKTFREWYEDWISSNFIRIDNRYS